MGEIDEILDFYKKQGAPGDQHVLISLLKEIQGQQGGGISQSSILYIAQQLEIPDSLLMALIRRVPSLHISGAHCLEICCGMNCSRSSELHEYTVRTYGAHPDGFTVKQSPCMRMCGKGPNVKLDGRIFHHANPDLVDSLIAKIR